MKPAAQRYEAKPRKAVASYQLEMGTKSLLAAFFALAIVCGLFFAFGFTIGKHAVPATFSLGGATQQAHRTPLTTAPLAPGVQPPNPAQLGAAETNQTPAALNPAPSTDTPTADATANGSTAAATTTAPPADPATTTTSAPPAVATAAAAANAGASQIFEVQVFAGGAADAGHSADALKARGYPAHVVPPAPGGADSLYRVQVGPYLTKVEAEAMRSRLTADGYQAVVKGNS